MPCYRKWWWRRACRHLRRGSEPRSHTLQEIADFSGVGFETMRRIEKTALSNLKKIMLELEIKNGNTRI